MDEDSQGAVPRTGRRLAFAAFLLTVTSMLLPWWRVTWASVGGTVLEEVRLFRPVEPLTTSWGPWLTGGLVVAVALLLFLRLAARSERHEPPTWRRDLLVAAGLLGAALLSCLLWPSGIPAFWGGRTLQNETITDGANATVEAAMPGLGWWLALLAALLLALAWRRARPAPPTTTK